MRLNKTNRKAGMAGTNLGTAWIQIKPSMRGMTSSIRSELAGIGSSEGGSAGQKFSTAFAAKLGIISGITQQAFMAVGRVITDQLGDAVYRADTLERFPKVMEMMGYNADEAAVSVEKLRKGVELVPTSLADVVSLTQRLTTMTKDVGVATDWALAISNAMLVTTGDVNEASRGMTQFLQVLAKGKPVGNDWNTILEVASPVMEELAHTLGYTSAALEGDFYTALQKGTLSIDEMMAALLKLDQEGSDKMASLSELAKTSAGGIATAMTTMKQSISNAMVAIIQEIGFDNIRGAIESIKNALVGLVQFIGGIITFIQTNWAVLEPIFTGILSFLGAVTAIFMAQKVYLGLTALFALINSNPLLLVFSTIIFAIAELIMHFDEVKATIEAVFSYASEVLSNFGAWAGEVFQGIWNTVTDIFSNIGSFFAGIWESITNIFASIGHVVAEAVSGAFKGAVNGLLAFIENFINTPVNILNGFLDIINDAFGWLGVHLDHIEGVHLPRLYTGGIVQGIGTDTSDSNLYALSKGEYVIRAAAARDIGYDNLNRMNQTGELVGSGQTNYFTINGYNKSPEELADIISRKIAFNQRGVIG